MGLSQSKKIQLQVFHVSDWQLTEWQPYTNIKDPTYSSNFKVYINKNNPNLQIQKYVLYFNSQGEYISYLQIFYQRKKCPYLVNSLHIQQITKKNMCSTFLSANIYLERIHFRLYQLIQIPIEEGLFIINSSLEGYNNMFNKTGYFDISSDMIGINKQGKVKVWFNKNFAKNFPEFNKIDHNKGQADFIINLIKVIEQSIDYPKDMQKFSEYLQKKQLHITFSLTKTFLKQYHINYKLCPQRQIKSIVLWLKKNNINNHNIYNNNNNNNNNNSKKNIFSQNQQMLLMKTSSFSSKSHENKNNSYNNTKTNQQSQKTIKNFYHRRGSKKIQFSKIKSKKNNPYTKYTNQKTSSSGLTLINKTQIKNPTIDQNNNQDRQRYTLPVYQANNGTIHIPIIKYERKPIQFNQIPLKNTNKLPSVSFSYKNGGVFSPQNHQIRQSGWFSNKTQLMEQQVKQNKASPVQLNHNNNKLQNIVPEQQKLYCTSTDIYQIDPDIAKDLNSLQQLWC